MHVLAYRAPSKLHLEGRRRAKESFVTSKGGSIDLPMSTAVSTSITHVVVCLGRKGTPRPREELAWTRQIVCPESMYP